MHHSDGSSADSAVSSSRAEGCGAFPEASHEGGLLRLITGGGTANSCRTARPRPPLPLGSFLGWLTGKITYAADFPETVPKVVSATVGCSGICGTTSGTGRLREFMRIGFGRGASHQRCPLPSKWDGASALRWMPRASQSLPIRVRQRTMAGMGMKRDRNQHNNGGLWFARLAWH